MSLGPRAGARLPRLPPLPPGALSDTFAARLASAGTGQRRLSGSQPRGRRLPWTPELRHQQQPMALAFRHWGARVLSCHLLAVRVLDPRLIRPPAPLGPKEPEARSSGQSLALAQREGKGRPHSAGPPGSRRRRAPPAEERGLELATRFPPSSCRITYFQGLSRPRDLL